jgi:hypothetical protein
MIVQIVILFICLGSEISLMIWDFRLSQKVFEGHVTSLNKQLGISILSGISLGLFIIIIALFVGLLGIGFRWSLKGIIGISFIAIVLFFLGTIGSIWRFFIAGKLRSQIIKKISDKSK